ncbi:MAG: hypothetical protein HRT57_03695 [Crocinitomicaceae bacterium]|nr:hypothetical protein [Crocinitomicaceae bacterium]
MDSQGRVLMSVLTRDGEGNIDLSKYSKGIYYIQSELGNSRIIRL